MATGALVEEVAEEVALNLEEVAQVTRKINASGVGIFVGGVVVGIAVGLYFGRRWQQEKLREEAYAESKAEVEQLREVYAQKALVAEPKPTVEEIIERQGYSTAVEMDDRLLPAPVPIIEREPLEVVKESVEELVVSEDKPVLDIWNFPHELESRSPDKPYVIHQNELGETNYDHVTYTYYAEDDVLCDSDDTPLPYADTVVGEDNLKWGHGSDDIDVVFVRNDKLELDMEICRSHKSYEQEVLGHDHDEVN